VCSGNLKHFRLVPANLSFWASTKTIVDARLSLLSASQFSVLILTVSAHPSSVELCSQALHTAQIKTDASTFLIIHLWFICPQSWGVVDATKRVGLDWRTNSWWDDRKCWETTCHTHCQCQPKHAPINQFLLPPSASRLTPNFFQGIMWTAHQNFNFNSLSRQSRHTTSHTVQLKIQTKTFVITLSRCRVMDGLGGVSYFWMASSALSWGVEIWHRSCSDLFFSFYVSLYTRLYRSSRVM